jgi:hypothetical protein
MTKLLAARFKNNDTLAQPLEQFKSVESAGIRWQLDKFGMTRMEVIVNRTDAFSAFDSYANHQGQRLALYSDWVSLPISGWITECVWLSANQIKYIVKGPSVRMMEKLVRRFYDSSTTLTDVIENVLDSYVTIDDGTTDEIEANATTTNGWNPDQPEGEYPINIIRDILKLSNSNFDIIDFWFTDNPMLAGSLQQYKPHYQARDTAVLNPDWVLNRRDIDKLNLSRGITNVATVSRVWYGLVAGTFTAVAATVLTDAGATFITDGVSPGDKITNINTGGVTNIVNVVSQTQLNFDGWKAKTTGTADGGSTTTLTDATVDFIDLGVLVGDVLTNINDFSTGTITSVATNTLTIAGAMSGGKTNEDGERYEVSAVALTGDDYSIKTTNPNRFEEVQIEPNTEAFWPSEVAEFINNSNSTQAAQIAELGLSNEAEQEQSFTVRSDFIRDGNGSEWPLWQPIVNGGGTVQIVDLFPEATASLNQETVFKITAMDYDHKSRQLRFTVDNVDAKLDAKLERRGILSSTTIQRL